MAGIMAGTIHTTIGINPIAMIGIMVGIAHTIGVGAIHTPTITTIAMVTTTTITTLITIHIAHRMADLRTIVRLTQARVA